MASRFCLNEACLRQEFSQIQTPALGTGRPDAANRLEVLLARERPRPDTLRTARTHVAASAAHLPIAPEMAWTLPQLLKRLQLVSPGILSTSAALRSLIAMPEWDEQFAKAFAESGFLSCDRTIGQVRWKYDLGEMAAKQDGGSAWEVLELCRGLLERHRTRRPVDWEGALAELRTLASWFPELRTIGLLEQLYARLYALHMKSVLVVRCWLDWRAGMADGDPDSGEGTHHA